MISLEQVEQRITGLPPLSTAVTHVLELLNSGVIDYAPVAHSLSRDQALVARVLQLANSAFFGFKGEISGVRHACMVLGVNALRHVVIAAGVIDQFPSRDSQVMDRGQLWSHATDVAVTCKVISVAAGEDAEFAFSAGLLHDLGKLALDAYFPQQYRQVMDFKRAEDCHLREAETEVLGFDHGLIGARLAQHWGLPEDLVDIIARHHTPDQGEPLPLLDILHLADCLAHGLFLDDEDLVPELSEAAWTRLDLGWERISELLPEIETLGRGFRLEPG